MAKLFKTSLFGYRKKDVTKYVEEISSTFQLRIDECEEKIQILENKRHEIEELREKIEREKDKISEAIVSAHEKAEKIIADARDKMHKEEALMQRKLNDENQKLIQIRREIHNIRRNAIKTLSNLDVDNEETEE